MYFSPPKHKIWLWAWAVACIRLAQCRAPFATYNWIFMLVLPEQFENFKFSFMYEQAAYGKTDAQTYSLLLLNPFFEKLYVQVLPLQLIHYLLKAFLKLIGCRHTFQTRPSKKAVDFVGGVFQISKLLLLVFEFIWHRRKKVFRNRQE